MPNKPAEFNEFIGVTKDIDFLDAPAKSFKDCTNCRIVKKNELSTRDGMYQVDYIGTSVQGIFNFNFNGVFTSYTIDGGDIYITPPAPPEDPPEDPPEIPTPPDDVFPPDPYVPPDYPISSSFDVPPPLVEVFLTSFARQSANNQLIRYELLNFHIPGTYTKYGTTCPTGVFDGWDMVKSGHGSYVFYGGRSQTVEPYYDWGLNINSLAYTVAAFNTLMDVNIADQMGGQLIHPFTYSTVKLRISSNLHSKTFEEDYTGSTDPELLTDLVYVTVYLEDQFGGSIGWYAYKTSSTATIHVSPWNLTYYEPTVNFETLASYGYKVGRIKMDIHGGYLRDRTLYWIADGPTAEDTGGYVSIGSASIVIGRPLYN